MFDWAKLRPIWEPRMLSILRIMVGLLFLEHGLNKIFDFRRRRTTRPTPCSPGAGAAGILELVGGALIAFGLFTRPVAFILAGDMAFAYFMRHAPKRFFPADQRRRCGNSLLFHFPLFLCGGRRRVEPRSAADNGALPPAAVGSSGLTAPSARPAAAELTQRPAGVDIASARFPRRGRCAAVPGLSADVA